MGTQACVVGIVATEPKQIITAKGISLCSFRLASSERRFDRATERWVEGETSWFTVTAFRTLGEHVKASFAKGNRVIVSGKLRVRQWEQDGKYGTAVDIDADALGHDLRWGTSTFTKDVTFGGKASQESDDAPADIASPDIEQGDTNGSPGETVSESRADVGTTTAENGESSPLDAWANPAVTPPY